MEPQWLLLERVARRLVDGELMRVAWLLSVLLAVLLTACHTRETASADRPAAVDPHVAESCTSCHGADIIAQQRLTPAQWTKVITKMAGWGALIPTDTIPALSTKLAEASGPYTPTVITSETAEAELSVRDDGPYASGDAGKGAALFASLCVSCHGENARGAVGVNLVDRPLLGHARAIATVVRLGRHTMPAFPNLKDAELADLNAYLRAL